MGCRFSRVPIASQGRWQISGCMSKRCLVSFAKVLTTAHIGSIQGYTGGWDIAAAMADQNGKAIGKQTKNWCFP